MNSDITPQTDTYFGSRGLNTILNEFPALRAANFICAEPRWLSAITLGLCLLSGCALAYLGASASTLPSAVILLLGIASALLLVALRPTRGSIHYASNDHGVYFPSRRTSWIVGRAKDQTWLFVPWSNISRISVQPLLDESGKKSVTFCLRASDEERRLYFPLAATLDLGEESRISTGCSILVGYPSAFKSPYRIASILCGFQQHSDEDNARIDLTSVSDH